MIAVLFSLFLSVLCIRGLSNTEIGGHYRIEKSTALATTTPFLAITLFHDTCIWKLCGFRWWTDLTHSLNYRSFWNIISPYPYCSCFSQIFPVTVCFARQVIELDKLSLKLLNVEFFFATSKTSEILGSCNVALPANPLNDAFNEWLEDEMKFLGTKAV